MRKLLILPALCLFFAARLHSQVPSQITIKNYQLSNPPVITGAASACNAGSFTIGPLHGQSNDFSPDTIFLCWQDSIFINHNGNATFMDPQSLTQPGVGYILYSCPPTVAGSDTAAINDDPCIFRFGVPPNVNPFISNYVATGGDPINRTGDLWFRNFGTLQNAFNMGQPIQMWYAAATLDDHDNQAWEVVNGNSCINVNIADAFSIVYLNEITVQGINTNAGAGCLGQFQIRGGLPQFDNTKKYTIDIFLASDPTVKGVIHTQPNQFNHGGGIIFSVPVSGIYTVTVEDGKSCGATFQINMSACDPTQNIGVSAPNLTVPPGGQICIPLKVENFNGILSYSFNMTWDPTVLQYASFQNVNPLLVGFNPAQDVTPFGSSVSLTFLSTPLNGVSIPDGGSLLEICFNVLGTLGDCTPITSPNAPAQIDFTNNLGEPVGFTFTNGQVCVGDPQISTIVTTKDTCNTPGQTSSISITVSDGSAPYDITYTGPNGPSSGTGTIGTPGGVLTINNVSGGNYTVIVIDAAGNRDTTMATLVVKSMGVNLDFFQPTCSGDCDGIANALITLNGNQVNNFTGYSFNWSPTQPNAQSISGLCSGPYSVTVTNATEGCVSSASASMSQPPPIANLNLAVVNASCTGVKNGSISYLAQGGSPFPGGDYQFSWAYSTTSGGTKTPRPDLNQTANPATITGEAAGFYFLTITDSKGCTATGSVEVTAAKTLTMTAAQIVNTSCFGSSDGSANIQVSTTPNQPNQISFWTYVPNPTGSTSNPGSTSISVNNLPGGMYTFTAVDTAGCSVVQSFTVGSPAAILVSTSVVNNPTCTNPNSGAVVLNFPSGGTPPFTFKWDDPAGATSQNLSSVPAGNYTVTVTDTKMCTNTLSVTLTLPPPPPVQSVEITPVKCGADGCVEAKIAAGPYTFLWSNLTGGASVGSTAKVCNLDGGDYIIVVKDAQNCEFRDTVSLTGVAPLVFTDTLIAQPSCFGLTDGSLSVSVGGGTSPYDFQWLPQGSTSQVLVNIAAGIYSVTVTDQNDCTKTGTFALPNPPAITVSFNNIKAANCDSQCDGAVDVVTGYATTPPTTTNFRFSWEDNPGLDDSTRTNLCAGFVTVTITDGKNCFRVDSVFIDAPPPVVADTSYTIPARCDGESNGSACVNGAGGNGGPYTYDWGGNFPMTNCLNGILDSGQYIVTIVDKDGCEGTQILVVQDPDPVVVLKDDLLSQDIICNGTDSGVLGVSVSGGNQNQGVFKFIWTNGLDTVGNTSVIDGLGTGQYFVTVTDPLGCSGENGPFELTDPPPVQGTYLPWEILKCYGDQTTLYIDTIFGGSGGPYQYSVDFGVTLDKDFPVSVGGGSHTVTFFDRVGCSIDTIIEVAEPEQILVVFNPKTIEIELGDSTDLRPLITGAAVDSFFWTPILGLSDPLSLNPYVTTYKSQTYLLTVFDNNGCSGEGMVRVDVDPNRNVFVPNIFQPGTTLNDRFQVFVGAGVKNVNFMKVYDRWGESMYERLNFFPNNNDFSEGWDGTSRGKKMNPGVYVYIIEVEFLDGLVLLYRGDVTLSR